MEEGHRGGTGGYTSQGGTGGTGGYTAQEDVDNLNSDVQSNVYTLFIIICDLNKKIQNLERMNNKLSQVISKINEAEIQYSIKLRILEEDLETKEKELYEKQIECWKEQFKNLYLMKEINILEENLNFFRNNYF